ncbi:hypothetical protein SKAU_G00241280 [Synaphobranchus kaupii]|uniref:Uncharacterized protein n=1 Tax=Synaphobranchus kaupii TaxID=118154 RepID=A0A9Q1F7I2_SYNKA|nr:hypothetical protein SKAU_G00241280 [Synaphobranchus kaupii]
MVPSPLGERESCGQRCPAVGYKRRTTAARCCHSHQLSRSYGEQDCAAATKETVFRDVQTSKTLALQGEGRYSFQISLLWDPLTRPAAAPKTPAKLPKYNGTMQLEPYLSQVQLAAWHSGRSNEEAATHQALALEGRVLQVLLYLASAEQRNLQALTMALEWRFGRLSVTRAGSS